MSLAHTSGLLKAKLDGATISRHWRSAKSAIAALDVRQPAHAGCGGVPPLLGEQEGLRHHVEGRQLPIGAEKRRSAGAGLAIDQGVNFAVGSDQRFGEAIGAAQRRRSASASCLPGEAARCSCQSAKASASAAGETPPVNRASVACTARSIASGTDGGAGEAAGQGVSCAAGAGTGNGTIAGRRLRGHHRAPSIQTKTAPAKRDDLPIGRMVAGLSMKVRRFQVLAVLLQVMQQHRLFGSGSDDQNFPAEPQGLGDRGKKLLSSSAWPAPMTLAL